MLVIVDTLVWYRLEEVQCSICQKKQWGSSAEGDEGEELEETVSPPHLKIFDFFSFQNSAF